MELYNAGFTLPSKDLLTFAKAPAIVVFLPGEHLFRFGTIKDPTFEGSRIFESPWWIPPATYRQITETAHRTGTSIVDVARSRLAVATAWNPVMDWLMVLELRKAVQAWVGPTRPQPLSAGDRSVMLLGNYDQAYVPGLAPKDATASEAATLIYFGQPLDQ